MTEPTEEHAPPARGIPADTFAHRLMLARSHAGGLSIREAAELCGFGRGSWTNWEGSRNSMPADFDYVTEVISEKLGVDVDWLRRGGQLAEPEARSRKARWSTIRPVHGRSGQITTHEYGGVAERMTEKVTRSSHRPPGRAARDARPKGRPDRVAPAPTLRRAARIGSASPTA